MGSWVRIPLSHLNFSGSWDNCLNCPASARIISSFDNIFMEGKLLPRLTFNPELALTGFRTTRPRRLILLFVSSIGCSVILIVGKWAFLPIENAKTATVFLTCLILTRQHFCKNSYWNDDGIKFFPPKWRWFAHAHSCCMRKSRTRSRSRPRI